MATEHAMTALVLVAATTTVSGFFFLVYRLKRQPYLLWWTLGWFLLALHYGGAYLYQSAGEQRLWALAASRWLLGLAVLLLLASVRMFARLGNWPLGYLIFGLVFGTWSFLQTAPVSWHLPLNPEVGAAAVNLYIAWLFWRESRRRDSFAEALLACAFGLWALALAAQAASASFIVDPSYRLLSANLPQQLIAVLMVMTQYEDEKRRVERNMLALSSLNLATSSFGAAGEMDSMMRQALDRILNVVHVQAGCLWLRHTPPFHGRAAFLGLTERFIREVRSGSLDGYLVDTVARLGGLIVFRDLTRDESWSALEREPEFGRFVQAAQREGLRNVVGISLQAKEQVFGLMMLGTGESRCFSPAELRLLLALGHQMGIAVENSWLLQQTTRRTEELNAMREIGRVLSSTLATPRLLETIYSEIRKLFSVDNFYIAFYDAAQEMLHFAFEAVAGVVQPSRSRAAGNHLTEYMLRTRQPVLIREPFDETLGEMGQEPGRSFRSFCGVPLVLYNRAIGAMAIYHEQERQFDPGHLDVLKILASEAAIALENARLFAEEQKRSRHLAVLNNISRRAITTLEPAAMLAEIMQELSSGLSYDHIGIGILDYNAKEVSLQAEAGTHRGEIRRRVPIGSGVMGEAARDGKMVIAEKIKPEENRALLPDARSALASPIAYADQVIGVLNIERRHPGAFSPEEILLFQTLADQLAGALHNAYMFQKAQEQAITDGLTAVKTHRYFMEALQSEWKRSTRTSRCFSLVLLDLDRFKFVNDFYGHLEGDVVLQRIGRILEQNCRRSDVVARYGGDEFVILMPESPAEQARGLAIKLRAWIAADPLLHEKNITASFGLATFPMHGSTQQELIQVADASMYVAKHQGGNTVSSTDHPRFGPAHRWNKDVVEAYLGVTLKRLFATGPEAFDEVYQRLQKFMEGLPDDNGSHGVPGAVIDTVTSLAFAIDAKDHYTQGHSQKVAEYGVRLGRMLGLSEKEVEEIRLAGFVHDVGKVGIPERILHKPARLDPDEWEVMKAHAYLGAKILEPLRGITCIQGMVKHHHEFVDGSGYPDGLRGTEIPLGARILAIADAYDTMTSDRTYRPARSPEEGLAELERCAGSQFDAHLVSLFAQGIRSEPAVEVPAATPSGKEEIH